MSVKISNKGRRFNGWKWAFIGLVSLMIIGLVVVFTSLFAGQTTNQTSNQATVPYESGQVINTESSMSRDSFNQLLNALLADDQSPYRIYVDDQVNFESKVSLLGQEIGIEIAGDPRVDEQQNIAIDINRIELGGLDLPTSLVMQAFAGLIDSQVPLDVDAADQVLTVRLDQASQQLPVEVSAQYIDLANDRIDINFDIPTKFIAEQIEANVK
ncbi:hypothetical protein AWM75_01225 [Aerococcus urinaehominis]|uniref:Uncharacterized protein n=1 Tax=Aerococcus urinaehominis TaxID=128944 RepID=A0A0X8FJY7_9LACT|nr:YpmS family protein [Aerococcus urinaehominis]AMB98698.1 hypothetical protein AWM75_01225 [Aerococcus urinaehominis]SDL99088.1 Uncharacterized protein YpmS [Aerococcus urinaehominis]